MGEDRPASNHERDEGARTEKHELVQMEAAKDLVKDGEAAQSASGTTQTPEKLAYTTERERINHWLRV